MQAVCEWRMCAAGDGDDGARNRWETKGRCDLIRAHGIKMRELPLCREAIERQKVGEGEGGGKETGRERDVFGIAK